MSSKRFPETNIGFVVVSSFIFHCDLKLAPNPKQFDLEGFFYFLVSVAFWLCAGRGWVGVGVNVASRWQAHSSAVD